ncbi:MAG TPA: hypothetical protein VFC85_03230 [Verrucomicrobiae bacterium]|nr:hypothetical protein [Verrucomicrobiae bacterium]
MNDKNRERFKWLAVFVFGLSLFLMLVMSVILYHNISFANQLAEILGHSISNNQRLAISLALGFIAELLFSISAYFLLLKIFSKRLDR